MDLAGIEPAFHPCHGRVLPVYYRPFWDRHDCAVNYTIFNHVLESDILAFMDWLHIFTLSLIEGVTEFLPISSTGHLILAAKLMKIPESNFVKTFEIVIQLGAIMAVVVLYTKEFLNIKLLKKLFVAFIPTAIVGFTLYPIIKNYFLGSSSITLHALFWGGIALIVTELVIGRRKSQAKQNQSRKLSDISYKQAFTVGCFQSLSVIPGVSRAAATIVGGLVVGLERSVATEFSFLLAVPTMIGATGLDLYKSKEYLSTSDGLTLFAGTVFSFVFAMIAIKFLVNYVKKHNFILFGVYRILLAILFWIFVIK